MIIVLVQLKYYKNHQVFKQSHQILSACFKLSAKKQALTLNCIDIEDYSSGFQTQSTYSKFYFVKQHIVTHTDLFNFNLILKLILFPQLHRFLNIKAKLFYILEFLNLRRMKNYKKKESLSSFDKSIFSNKTIKLKRRSSLKNIIEVSESSSSSQENISEKQNQKIILNETVQIKERTGCMKRLASCLMNLGRLIFRVSTINIDSPYSEFSKNIDKQYLRKSAKPILPPQLTERYVLVLDLDNTLVHSSFSKPHRYDFQLNVIYNGVANKIYLTKRFGLDHFIFQMSQIFQIITFTASHKLYADQIINRIDPKGLISHRIYRQNCVQVQNRRFLKNINNLGRKIEKTILVDDSTMNGLLQPENFYLIPPFTGDSKDRHLCRLSAFLKYVIKKQRIQSIPMQRSNFDRLQINLKFDENIQKGSEVDQDIKEVKIRAEDVERDREDLQQSTMSMIKSL